ncbi:unnamed protein product [Mytilus edulis]|uniref:VWFA domain-containing protein n=1 Tax=Mytilus edulis TaxID=6550 RepID=A0A8S3R6W7_MYTED|nr:unnamed protein product [Mytilus edulis]
MTKTHLDITAAGTLRAIDKYIKSNKGSGSIDDFFSEDTNGKDTMLKKVFALRKAVADTQENKKDTAYIHCHADQIDLAHNFVKSCKQKLNARKNDTNEFITQLGECLYTIQSFYSNTNWVEMKGGIVYEDFGISTLMDVAALEEDTCLDNADYNSECKNNIIVSGKLTSGYHHRRGNTKPAKAIGSSTGKCSHGGPDDDSRKLVARCGINKDSLTPEWSPHFHLHKQAYTAAVQATENFLVANGTGVLKTIGPKLFEAIFHVKRRKDMTLAMAIDYTSSMADDIDAVKKYVINQLTATVGSANEPADYVLSLFHDPVTWNVAFRYTDGYAMINKVQTLETEIGNNRDCPEYAAAGILAAIALMRDDSPLLVFTDADSKMLTVAKNQCTRRKRSALGRSERSVSSLSFFQQIAKATGGNVHETDKENIGNVLETIIGETFPSSEIIIDSFEWSSTETDETDVDIYYANGKFETYRSGKSTRIYTSSGETIISIQQPPGEYHEPKKEYDVVLGKERVIGYEVSNQGTVTETYQVSISDDHSFVQGTMSVDYTLLPGDNANGTFVVKPTTTSVIFSYTISVLIVSTGKIQQSITRKLVTAGVCGVASLNTANCSLYNWTASAEVTFFRDTVRGISSTGWNVVKLSHVNITGLSTGPLAVNISMVVLQVLSGTFTMAESVAILTLKEREPDLAIPDKIDDGYLYSQYNYQTDNTAGVFWRLYVNILLRKW